MTRSRVNTERRENEQCPILLRKIEWNDQRRILLRKIQWLP